MTTGKHPQSGHEPHPLPADDLDENPGIKASRGTTRAGEDPHLIEGENTVEGDTAEDTDATGATTREWKGRDH
jgi:hypothetical protein